MSRAPKVPSYSLHKPSGLAVVKIKGRSFYLGMFGSDESREAYARIIADQLAGRTIKYSTPANRGKPTPVFAVTIGVKTSLNPTGSIGRYWHQESRIPDCGDRLNPQVVLANV